MDYILMYGNPYEGFEFVGPFENGTDAVEYADNEIGNNYEYWAIALVDPNDSDRK